MASPATEEQGHVFIGPGLSPVKRIVTLIAVLGLIVVVLLIALHQGASALGSTIAALLLIVGFIIFLRMITPVPFTITLEPEALVKRNRNGEVIEVRWEDLTRIKEEFFPNGKRISVIVYRKPATPAQKTSAPILANHLTNDAGASSASRSGEVQGSIRPAKGDPRVAPTGGRKEKAWAVYRDDVIDIDGLAEALKQAVPETCEWKSETVHD